jgi:hypothetical protein
VLFPDPTMPAMPISMTESYDAGGWDASGVVGSFESASRQPMVSRVTSALTTP